VDAAEVGQCADADPDTAAESLQTVGGHAVTAIVTLLADCTAKGQPRAWKRPDGDPRTESAAPGQHRAVRAGNDPMTPHARMLKPGLIDDRSRPGEHTYHALIPRIGSEWTETPEKNRGVAVMHGNAENDDGALEKCERYDGELDAEDADAYTDPSRPTRSRNPMNSTKAAKRVMRPPPLRAPTSVSMFRC
jgi:hypothetical protein